MRAGAARSSAVRPAVSLCNRDRAGKVAGAGTASDSGSLARETYVSCGELSEGSIPFGVEPAAYLASRSSSSAFGDADDLWGKCGRAPSPASYGETLVRLLGQ